MKITRIFKNNTNKLGVPYKDKNGKPFSRVVVMFEGETEYATIMAYANSKALGWAEGDNIDCKIEQNGDFRNIILPDKVSIAVGGLEERMTNFARAINTQISGLDRRLRQVEEKQVSGTTTQLPPQNAPERIVEPTTAYPDNNIYPEDLLF